MTKCINICLSKTLKKIRPLRLKEERNCEYVNFYRFQFKRLVTFLMSCCIIFSTFSYASEHCQTEAPPAVLTKDIALNRLLQCNLEIIDSRRFIIANEANLTQAGETQNPNLSIGVGNINPKLGIGAGSYFDKTIDTSVRYEQLIERGNKRNLRVKSAQGIVSASKQDVLETERQQSIVLLSAMVDVAASNERINLLSQMVDLYKETLRANSIRLENGDLSPLDAERQRIDAHRAQIDLHQAQSDAKVAQLTLVTLLDWGHQTDALTVDSAILDVEPIEAQQFDLASRTDVKAAKLRIEAASQQLELARAQLKSDITAGVQYDHWPTSGNNATGTGDTISFTLGFPLTVNNHYEGEIAIATSNYDAAKEALVHIEANAKSEWQRMNADMGNAQENLQLLQKELLPHAEDVARTVELGYAKGALGLLDLLEARRILRQTRLDTLSARASLARSIFTRNQSISANNIN
ncbi:outer membrane efflux protein [Methylotenera versatilis 301]|uniref:Outer membrane efflux protein n=2 Tax=Methylotenera TaxID=359407 RepID=D7DMC7_METV0|nr:outer membrane efflux protein [Methylotenera versatilis 301]